MNDTKTNVKTASKDILARLMASEDIAVEHRADAQTASFNTKSRVLTLPIWQDMDDSLYDMLVGHEVAHALWTPTDEWGQEMGRFGDQNIARYLTFVNIVEDARIERKIKAKFPGIRRDFYAAYQDLAARDLFEIGDKNLSDLPLIDRLNLQFKIGSFVDVPFTDEETKWIDALENTNTFSDVCEVAAELFEDHVQNEQQQEAPVENADEGDAGVPDGADGEESDESGAAAPSPGESSEDTGAGGSDTPTEESSDDPDSGAGQSEIAGDDGADCGASMTDDTDDGSSADSIAASTTDGENAAGDPMDSVGSTQNAFDRAVRNLNDVSASDREYFPLPKTNLKNTVIDFTRCHTEISDFINSRPSRVDALASAQRQLKTFENESKKTVNMMAQQFMRRQSADEQHRTSISKTGILDMNKAISYKWNEDLFLRHEEIADGKNHGLVLFVDWSGSMCEIMEDTIKQMLQLVFFCRKVGIPFEVYSFTSNYRGYPKGWTEMTADERDEWHEANRRFDSDWTNEDFNLVNYLSSRMNARQMKTALAHMMYLCNSLSNGYWDGGFEMPKGHGLGCTPLNEAIIAATEIVPEFRTNNNLQIVNTIFLTDGESSGRLRAKKWESTPFLRDEKTKKTYDATNTSAALLSMLKDRTGANTVGIYLNAARNLRTNYYHSYTEEQILSYKKDGFVSTTSAGYTEYFVVKADKKVENDYLDNISSDASYTRIKNAFIKASSSRVNSRVLLNRVIDLIAA